MRVIDYVINPPISVDDFIDVLTRSSLAARRPVDDRACIQSMLDNCNLLVGAYHGSTLVGVARSLTDFTYCCYLSDLAVDEGFQHEGIGKRLIDASQSQLGKHCKIILLAAPAAVRYYPRIGFNHHPQAWILSPAPKKEMA
jgi:GNAT superfamily N-acetyltransferase